MPQVNAINGNTALRTGTAAASEKSPIRQNPPNHTPKNTGGGACSQPT